MLASIFGLDTTDSQVAAAIIAGLVALFIAAFSGLAVYVTAKRDRRRNLYSEAYKAALGWREVLYRVRRRAAGEEATRALVERFHGLQETIDYYQGWIATESPWLARSYCRLVGDVKSATDKLIAEAWKAPPRDPTSGTPEDDKHPELSEATERFLFDVRSHLAIWLVPKLFVVWRNRKWFGGMA
jgi:hypothetical protein